MRLFILILSISFPFSGLATAPDCKPLSSDLMQTSKGAFCRLNSIEPKKNFEEDIYFAYAAKKRLENLNCGRDVLRAVRTSPKLLRQLQEDTIAKALLIKNLRVNQSKVLKDLVWKRLPREEMKALEKRKNEIGQAIESIFSSMYQGNTQKVRDFAEEIIAATDLENNYSIDYGYMNALDTLIVDIKKQIPEVANLSKSKKDYPDEFKRSLTKDIEIRTSFVEDFGSKEAGPFVENLTCQLDEKYGYRREEYETKRDVVLNIASMAVPLGTGFTVAKYGLMLKRGGAALRFGGAIGGLGLTTLGSIESLSRSCSNLTRDFKISECSKEKLEEFALNNLEKQNCFLEAALTGIQGGGSLVADLAAFRAAKGVKPEAPKPIEKPAAKIVEKAIASEKEKVVPSVYASPLENISSQERAALAKRARTMLGSSKAPSGGIQTGIWKLKSQGHLKEAAALEEEIANNLHAGRIVSETPVGEGVSGARFVEYEDGTRGIWKPSSGRAADGDNEVAAAIIDRHLGTDMVPITVDKPLMGKSGTVQLRAEDLIKDDLDDRPASLSLFDSLIGNYDRHRKNYLVTKEGRVVAIDHGLAFQKTDPLPYNEKLGYWLEDYAEAVKEKKMVQEKLERMRKSGEGNPKREDSVRKELAFLERAEAKKKARLVSRVNMLTFDKNAVEKLRKTTPDDWKNMLGERLTKEQIQQIVVRQKEILKNIDLAEKHLGADAYPSGPFSPLVKDKFF